MITKRFISKSARGILCMAFLFGFYLSSVQASDPAPDKAPEKKPAKAPALSKKPADNEHVEEESATETAVPSKKGAAKLENVCLGSPAVIEELKEKQKEIAERERALGKQAEELKAKEAILMEEFAKLTKLREEVQGIQSNNKKMSEESIVRMVETVEKMSPKSAAQLLSKVNEPLAVEAIARLSTPKLAKVLAAMDANKASTLTEGLTRRGTKKEGAL